MSMEPIYTLVSLSAAGAGSSLGIVSEPVLESVSEADVACSDPASELASVEDASVSAAALSSSGGTSSSIHCTV